VIDGIGLDNLHAQYLGDPEQYWRICDANAACVPAELNRDRGLNAAHHAARRDSGDGKCLRACTHVDDRPGRAGAGLAGRTGAP